MPPATLKKENHMTEKTLYEPETTQRNSWLKSYYFCLLYTSDAADE